jgi:DNA modification methylase
VQTADSSTRLGITYRPTTSLTADERNPRTHNKAHIAALARSITAFGFNVPLLIDESGTLIAGHGRLAAAKKLNLREVPTILLEHLSVEQKRAFMIADNRLTDLSRWDEQILGETLRDLSLADLSFELDVIGFSVGEIDLRIEGLTDPDRNAAEDELPQLQAEAVTKLGDLWKLGAHRLICGDALDERSWKHLMDGQLAAVGFTDPPYNVKIDGFVSGLGKHRHREFEQGAGEMDRDQFSAFVETALRHMAKHSEKASIHFVAMDWRHSRELLAAGASVFTELKNICVWSKQAPGMGSLYRSQHEFVFVWKNGRGRHQNHIELGKHGRARSNIWSYPSAAAFRHSEGTDLLATHPTCKPVALVADAILDVSKRGEIVIDPFLGSGTTIIAAERVGRIAYGMELDPIYCDAIIHRFEALTGQEAVLDDGRTFGEVSAERLSAMGEAA